MQIIKRIGQLFASIGVVLAVGGLGSVFTSQGIPEWYATLAKPPLLPPESVFGPVWGVLYVVVGLALFLAWIAQKKQVGWLYVAFFAQLTLTALWCAVFFALHQPWLGVGVIVLLLATIVWAMRELGRVSVPAMSLFVPYLLWVGFATYLTLGVAILN